jgi:hypothetical protein
VTSGRLVLPSVLERLTVRIYEAEFPLSFCMRVKLGLVWVENTVGGGGGLNPAKN